MCVGVTGVWPHAQDHDQLAYEQLLYREKKHYDKAKQRKILVSHSMEY